MARRFGGKYSPAPHDTPRHDTPPDQDDIPPERLPRVEHPLEGRPFWIVVCAAPILLGAFGDGPVALVRALAAFAMIAGSAYTIREGLRAEAAFDARTRARRPALPRKILGALGLGAGLALAASAPDMGLWGAILAGATGTVLSLVAFRPDPMRDKGMAGVDRFQSERVARAVTEGSAHLDAMRQAIARAGLPVLETRVERFATDARALFRVVEEDPDDFGAARRYMGVYLEGARDATIRFADHWTRTGDAAARRDYEALLDDLQANFTARTRSLLEGNREGLEIEIDVLRERLAREGLAPQTHPADSAR